MRGMGREGGALCGETTRGGGSAVAILCLCLPLLLLPPPPPPRAPPETLPPLTPLSMADRRCEGWLNASYWWLLVTWGTGMPQGMDHRGEVLAFSNPKTDDVECFGHTCAAVRPAQNTAAS